MKHDDAEDKFVLDSLVLKKTTRLYNAGSLKQDFHVSVLIFSSRNIQSTQQAYSPCALNKNTQQTIEILVWRINLLLGMLWRGFGWTRSIKPTYYIWDTVYFVVFEFNPKTCPPKHSINCKFMNILVDVTFISSIFIAGLCANSQFLIIVHTAWLQRFPCIRWEQRCQGQAACFPARIPANQPQPCLIGLVNDNKSYKLLDYVYILKT